MKIQKEEDLEEEGGSMGWIYIDRQASDYHLATTQISLRHLLTKLLLDTCYPSTRRGCSEAVYCVPAGLKHSCLDEVDMGGC